MQMASSGCRTPSPVRVGHMWPLQWPRSVLFNNRKCYVVPPGMVDEIMTRVKPIVEYDRVGGLYLADLTLSSFGRQDVDQ